MLKKGLIFSQPALGIGQMMRSLYICKSLVEHFSIDFLQGAPGVNFPMESPHFHLYRLPPLWLQSWQDPPIVVDPTGKHSVEAVFEARAKYVKPILKTPYAFVLIELYPFSKWFFSKEIDAIIKKVKHVNPGCKIFCSLRDISGKKPLEDEKRIADKVNQMFDAVFVHADPSVVRLEESFSLVKDIEDKIIYTGYVSDPEKSVGPSVRQKRVVVSVGAGSFGFELLRAVSLAAIFEQEYEFLLVLGPKSPPEVRRDIEYAVKQLELSNIKIVEFLPNFYSVLRQSALSISLGGSTIIDVIATKTPALVYVDSHVEHVFRADKFAQKGGIGILHLGDLNPERLCPMIRTAAMSPFPEVHIDVSGAQKTAHLILDAVEAHEF